MIPIRLEMHNFLPYRAPDPLRFEGIHLACLTGPNGAGKSSILDAITWVLWGKARTNRDDDLIHQGQTDMHVCLNFMQEGITYRVIRKRERRGKTSAPMLDLFVISEDNQLNLISEPSIRATQSKINDLLRLDYETFVHSAFLQQGKADAFTTQTPAERKRILSEILGLGRWSVYEERVKTKLKTVEGELRTNDGRLEEINASLATEPAVRRELSEARTAHEQAREALEKAQALVDALRDAPGDYRRTQERKADEERRLRENQTDLQNVQELIARQTDKVAEYREIVEKQAEIQAGHSALQEARDVDESLSSKLTELRGIDEARAELNSKLSAEKARLESEAASLRKAIAEQEATIASNPADDLTAVQADVDALKTREAELNALNAQQTELKTERGGLDQRLKTLTDEGTEKRDRFDKLQQTESATCPLCGQPLDADHLRQLTEELQVELVEHRKEFAECRDRINEINRVLSEQQDRVKALELELKKLPALQQRLGSLSAQVEAAEQAARRKDEDSARVAQIEAALANDDYAHDLRSEREKLEEQQTRLGYDQASHDDARRTLKEYLRFEQLKAHLEIALKSLPIEEEALKGSQTRLERLHAAIAETNEAVAAHDVEIERLRIQVEEYHRREQEMRQMHTQEQQVRGRLNTAEQKMDSIDKQRERRIVLEKRQAEYRYQEGLYKELREAFGKKGLPAMIIETAIPELESTANNLLTRMTDGRMNLRLTTQKEKVTGGQTETLDIEISDELGTRSYELYSGGEAFRINFALRVALSQMLARRAGAHLRTLFIDEGFGTQDDSGRDKLVEAITAIQDNFDLILVITHIDELRDSFPVHVIVDKTANGSRISVR